MSILSWDSTPYEQAPVRPLRFLENQLLLAVVLGKDNRVHLEGISRLPLKKRRQAKWVLDNYEGLLRLQLDAPKRGLRPSVQKLLAQSKIRIENRHYVLGSKR